MPCWIDTFPLDALPPSTARVWRHDGRQIAFFRLESGEIHAVDNRCPHEGYPLGEGTVSGHVLTCNWHNFKYDLRDGRCVKGDEDVRRFPVQVTDGRVQVDVEEPDPGPRIAKRWASWRGALREERTAQVLRDTARLLHDGVDPREVVAALAAFDGRVAEFGATHVLPVCADVLRWLPRYPGVQAVIPLTVPIELCARTHPRRPARPAAAPIDPGSDPLAAGVRLNLAVEVEDRDTAEGLLRGALRRGWGREILEDWLFDAATAHFLDFGHAIIYQAKVFDLLDAVGWEAAEDVLVGHLVGILDGTREDTLPKWSRFRATMAAVTPRFPAWQAGTGATDLEGVLVGGRLSEGIDAVIAALDAGAAPAAVADALVLAGAERILRFDPSIDARRDVQDDWLSVTHCMTVAWAARETVQRWRSPLAMRALLWSARMVAAHRALDGERVPIGSGGTDLAGAVHRRDPIAALACEPTREVLEDLVLEDLGVQGIFVAHQLKTLVVGLDASRALDDPRPLQAAVRVLAAPMQERRVRRFAEEALALVVHGRTPKVLAP